MNRLIINTDSYFDGHRYHCQGPYRLVIEDRLILNIQQGLCGTTDLPEGFADARVINAVFVMPGLVEAHCHLFLDGAELDFSARSEYLKVPFETMLATARTNVGANLKSGITLIRDAGDKYGVNHAIRNEVSNGGAAVIRSPGLAIRAPKKYGAFMAREVSGSDEIVAAVNEAAKDSDDLKILLTGIIDFEAGAVTTMPQFDMASLTLIVETAAKRGLKTFAHCSGLEGLEMAVSAGVNSIEHGFFMSEALLDRMADKQIAWVPTFSPVHFQWAHPELAGWAPDTISNLRRILDNHFRHVEMAYQKGVPLVAGSDAGSYGARHGSALIDELCFFYEAGLPMQEVLVSATSRPRQLWDCPSNKIVAQNEAELILLRASPFGDQDALRQLQMVYANGELLEYSISHEATS